MHFWKFFFTSENKILNTTFFKFLQQINDYSKNDLVLQLVDDIPASCCTSLTTKSSQITWSITLRNLSQFEKLLVCWNQHEKFYLLIEFEENLRWWVDFVFFGSIIHFISIYCITALPILHFYTQSKIFIPIFYWLLCTVPFTL